MSDFEVLPIGTKARLEALEDYARKASRVLSCLTREAPEFMTIVAGERLAEPGSCLAGIEGRLRNAGRRYRVGGKS